jgi:hypothetical protein
MELNTMRATPTGTGSGLMLAKNDGVAWVIGWAALRSPHIKLLSRFLPSLKKWASFANVFVVVSSFTLVCLGRWQPIEVRAVPVIGNECLTYAWLQVMRAGYSSTCFDWRESDGEES